jgi:hypothetical protein
MSSGCRCVWNSSSFLIGFFGLPLPSFPPFWIISFDDTLQTENVASGFQVWISISPYPELH